MRLLDNFYHFDSALSFGFIAFLFIEWSIIVANFGHILYFLSLILLIIGCLSIFFLDWIFYRKKKWFSLQILFNIFQILFYGFLFFGLIIIIMGYFSFGFILLLTILISKVLRLFLVIQKYLQCRRMGLSTSISFNLKKRKIFVILFIFLFVFPSIVFLLGTTSYTVARKDVDINDIIGADQGSQAIQLSFYATLSSYNYLTNDTILRVLNGTDFGGGSLNPVEILLLLGEYELTSSSDALKLAQMVNKCTESGLRVWIWFVYDTVLYGHYPSFQNYQHLPEFKQVFDNWVQNYSLNIHGILFDNEMDQVIVDTDLSDIFSYLKVILNYRRTVQADWVNAVNMYESVANNWSAQGYEIGLIGMEMTLSDLKDGDPDIQQLQGIVNNPPDMWDRVGFMLYRGCEYHPTPYGRDYLYNLADLHKKLYGERAVVALGCMDYAAYKTVDNILKDIAILKSLNYSTVELFEFRAFYDAFEYNGLLSILNSTLNGWKYPRFQINFYTVEYLLRSALMLADLFLDFF
ncbi:MAG TPA: hypothetical protein VMV49_12890 [Candidatus Deferrimicrobium sp.]|nr:hypothetical protein [Candidatus Deferrimicrobium sp.]